MVHSMSVDATARANLGIVFHHFPKLHLNFIQAVGGNHVSRGTLNPKLRGAIEALWKDRGM
jgi:hypothetical protein